MEEHFKIEQRIKIVRILQTVRKYFTFFGHHHAPFRQRERDMERDREWERERQEGRESEMQGRVRGKGE